jgi:hypothetical protein
VSFAMCRAFESLSSMPMVWYRDPIWLSHAARTIAVSSTTACFQMIADPENAPAKLLMFLTLIQLAVVVVACVEIGQRRS